MLDLRSVLYRRCVAVHHGYAWGGVEANAVLARELYLEMMRRTGKEVPLLLQKVLGLRQNTGTSYKAWAFEGGTLPSPKEGRRDAAAHFFAGRVLVYSEDKNLAPAAATIT